MQQSSARCREGVVEDCCMLSILLAVLFCFNSFWHSVIPTSFFIFNVFTLFFSHKYGQDTVGSLATVNAVRAIAIARARARAGGRVRDRSRPRGTY